MSSTRSRTRSPRCIPSATSGLRCRSARSSVYSVSRTIGLGPGRFWKFSSYTVVGGCGVARRPRGCHRRTSPADDTADDANDAPISTTAAAAATRVDGDTRGAPSPHRPTSRPRVKRKPAARHSHVWSPARTARGSPVPAQHAVGDTPQPDRNSGPSTTLANATSGAFRGRWSSTTPQPGGSP